MSIFERDANIDNIVLALDIMFMTNGFVTPEQMDGMIDLMIDLKNRTTKPVMSVVAYSGSYEMEEAEKVSRKFQDSGVPAFPSIDRGSLALRKAWDYYRMKNRT